MRIRYCIDENKLKVRMMIKKTSIMLLLVFTSLVINQNSIRGEIELDLIPIDFKFVHATRSDLGDQVHVEFNDTLMPDNQVYGPDDEVWFSFTMDVAEFRLDPQQEVDYSQADYWFFAEEDEFGVYNETRFQGVLNLYLDRNDFGLSNIHNFGGTINTTQDLLQFYLTPGWHLLTVFAAEYVSDPTRTVMYWQTSKDEKWFYISADTTSEPPVRESSEDTVTVKANPLNNTEWNPSFDWNFLNIWPRAERTDGTSIEQTLNQEGQVARVEANYNVTTSSLWLNETNEEGRPQAVYYDSTHMGEGGIFWWINDGPVTSELETSFELNKGVNFIYFAAVGFRVYFTLVYDPLLLPRADVDSNVFIVENNIPLPSPFGFESFVLALAVFATISLYVKRKRN